MPFGARGREPRGAVARQLARRLVDRLASETALTLRPVFLVSLPEESSEAGYVVIGSTPDADLAAQYGASLGATHTLVGTLREGEPAALEVSLVDVAGRRVLRESTLPAPTGSLHELEHALAAWLGHALGVELADRGTPPARDERTYLALLAGMDAELNATLLASGDAGAAKAATLEALERYADALAQDPGCAAAEERLLVMAAGSLGGGLAAEHAAALEAVVEHQAGSWKVHYLLGELRRAAGDVPGAIVALEHAHALHPLATADRVGLAELYLASGTPGPARSHLRSLRRALPAGAPAADRVLIAQALIRLGDGAGATAELDAVLASAPAGEAAARARRLRLGLRRPDLERLLEDAGRQALEAPADGLDGAAAAFEQVRAAEPDLWEAEFGLGLIGRRRDDAAAAEAAFRRALALWPGQPDALHELGVTLLFAGDPHEALALLEEAAAARPADAGYLADAGYAQLRLGHLDLARERLDAAAALDPADPLTQAYRAELERVGSTIGRTS